MTAVASLEPSVEGLHQGLGDMRIDLQSLKAASPSGSGSTKGKGKAVELVGADRYLVEGPPTTSSVAVCVLVLFPFLPIVKLSKLRPKYLMIPESTLFCRFFVGHTSI